MPKKRYVIHCDRCNFTKIIDKPEDAGGLVEVRRAPVPIGVPALDGAKKKAVGRPPQQQRKMYKCPRCGLSMVVKDCNTPRSEWEKGEDGKGVAAGREDGFVGRPIPGDAPGLTDPGYRGVPQEPVV